MHVYSVPLFGALSQLDGFLAISIAESWGRRGRAMENSREGWKNRGSDGSRGDQGSCVLFERYRPPHDTVF